MKPSARLSTLFILSIFTVSVSNLPLASAGFNPIVSAQSETGVRHKVIGCAKEPRGECVGNECNCARWIIEWRSPDGRVWGISTAKTLEKLIESRDRDLAFERTYARFFRVAFDQKFGNPSQPICDGCGPSAPANTTRSGTAAIQTATSIYAEWTRKITDGMLSLRNVIFGQQGTVLNSPFNYAGGVLRDYANALRLVNSSLKHLRQDILITDRELGRLTGNLENSTADLRQATNVLSVTYGKLPQNVRNALQGTPSTSEVLTSVSTSTSSASLIGSRLVIQEGNYREEVPIANLNLKGVEVEVNAQGQVSIFLQCRADPSGSLTRCINNSRGGEPGSGTQGPEFIVLARSNVRLF